MTRTLITRTRLVALALALVAGTGSAAIAAETCSVAADQMRSKDELKAQLEGDGWTVRQIKDEGGCYEVYGIKADGTRMESLFDPASFEMVDEFAD